MNRYIQYMHVCAVTMSKINETSCSRARLVFRSGFLIIEPTFFAFFGAGLLPCCKGASLRAPIQCPCLRCGCWLACAKSIESWIQGPRSLMELICTSFPHFEVQVRFSGSGPGAQAANVHWPRVPTHSCEIIRCPQTLSGLNNSCLHWLKAQKRSCRERRQVASSGTYKWQIASSNS